MLCCVAWLCWSPENWSFEWEPVVVLIGLFTAYISADFQDMKTSKISDIANPNDIELAKKLLIALPANQGIEFLKCHDFFGRFRREDISEITNFRSEWDNIEHEFIDIGLTHCRLV